MAGAKGSTNQTGLLLMQLLQGINKPVSYESIMVSMEEAIKQPLDPQMRHTVNATLEMGVRLGFLHRNGNCFYVAPLTHDATIQVLDKELLEALPSQAPFMSSLSIAGSQRSKIVATSGKLAPPKKRPVRRAKTKVFAEPSINILPSASSQGDVIDLTKSHASVKSRAKNCACCLYCGFKHSPKLSAIRTRKPRGRKAAMHKS
ncbi:uncharacterized protein LOC115623367 [Scaptodrosophila lebanonensis]|uniref:Uncharacterized protein LOC115623367 n=1 Tax=Drosophila lebanonensis TaxID=7225 RepID=A0A6J2TEH9_DROLE|nr:uncharacterized protein LOC115623367 [Scaptodrosophila lebanonensis]